MLRAVLLPQLLRVPALIFVVFGEPKVEFPLLKVHNEPVEVVLELLYLVHPAGVEMPILHDFLGLAEQLIAKLLLGLPYVAGGGLRE